MNRLVLREDVAIRIEQGDNARIFPEVYRHVLQTRQISAVFGNARALCVSDAYVLQDFPLMVKDDQTFVAAADVRSRRRFGVAAEVAHESAIGMVFEFVVVAPWLAAIVVPQCISDEGLIASVAVDV